MLKIHSSHVSQTYSKVYHLTKGRFKSHKVVHKRCGKDASGAKASGTCRPRYPPSAHQTPSPRDIILHLMCTEPCLIVHYELTRLFSSSNDYLVQPQRRTCTEISSISKRSKRYPKKFRLNQDIFKN